MISLSQGYVECEGPNKRLYEFTGNIYLESAEQLEPIQSDQILLRGAQLRNTEWIYGLVIYSGHDSKLLQNASRAPLKRSRLDHVTNKQVYWVVVSNLRRHSCLLRNIFLSLGDSSLCSSCASCLHQQYWLCNLEW